MRDNLATAYERMKVWIDSAKQFLRVNADRRRSVIHPSELNSASAWVIEQLTIGWKEACVINNSYRFIWNDGPEQELLDNPEFVDYVNREVWGLYQCIFQNGIGEMEWCGIAAEIYYNRNKPSITDILEGVLNTVIETGQKIGEVVYDIGDTIVTAGKDVIEGVSGGIKFLTSPVGLILILGVIAFLGYLFLGV